MSDLYILGGAKGVGKTTLLSTAGLPDGMTAVHTGTFFRGNIYDYDRYRRAQEDLLARLDALDGDILLDTHYASYDKKNRRFLRGLSRKNLEWLDEERDLTFILVDSTPEAVCSQRRDDDTRRRITDYAQVLDELRMNRRYFDAYRAETGKEGIIILNHDIQQASQALYDYLR